MVQDVLIVSAAGGILCLDRVFVQLMVSRPIVAAPLIGLILGDPYTGLIAGAFMELFWIDRLTIGAYIPPNDTIAAILIAAASIESGRLLGGVSQGLIALAFLLFLPVGILAQAMDCRIVRGNETAARKVLEDVRRGDFRSVGRGHLQAVFKAGLFSALFILVALPAGIAAMACVYPRLTPWMVRGLTLVYAVIPLIGAAVALNTVHLRRTVPLFCASFLAATVLIGWLRGF
jgi:PTS system mannose-specific IIC component